MAVAQKRLLRRAHTSLAADAIATARDALVPLPCQDFTLSRGRRHGAARAEPRHMIKTPGCARGNVRGR
jgi:hypothetical protein